MNNQKPKVIYLASKPLGKRILDFLLKQKDIELVGVSFPEPLDCPMLPDDQKLLNQLDFDLLLSVNYTKRIKEPLLGKPRLGCINVHNSYNNRIRGRNCSSHAILLARETGVWHHGATIHYMVTEFDSGKIIASRACTIEETDTAKNLHEKTEILTEELIIEWFPRIWCGTCISYLPPEPSYMFKSTSLQDKEVKAEWLPLAKYDFVRALTFPPYERPFMLKEGKKTYLTIDSTEGNDLFLAIDKRCIYTLKK